MTTNLEVCIMFERDWGAELGRRRTNETEGDLTGNLGKKWEKSVVGERKKRRKEQIIFRVLLGLLP